MFLFVYKNKTENIILIFKPNSVNGIMAINQCLPSGGDNKIFKIINKILDMPLIA